MREIEQHSRISENLFVTSPLVNHLHFVGMTQYVNNIILVQDEEIPNLNTHTKRYLQEIAPLTHSHSDQAQPIFLEE